MWKQQEKAWNILLIWKEVTLALIYPIEWLRLTLQAVKHLQNSPLYSISFIIVHGKKAIRSTMILETQAVWNLPNIAVSTVAVAQ